MNREKVGATLVSRPAAVIIAIDADLVDLDKTITARFSEHKNAEIVESMPGFGPILAATFLAKTGGDLCSFESSNRLASVAGVAPAPRDSGRITGDTPTVVAALPFESPRATSTQNARSLSRR